MGESCRFSLDYAYFHVAANFMLLWVLWRQRRTFSLTSAHVFGLVALLFDYGIFYLIQGTRTVELVLSPGDASVEGSDIPGPFGMFLFFMWYDYFGAFFLIIWAREFQTMLNGYEKNGNQWISVLVLAHQPLLFWSAPVLAPFIGFDTRVLLVDRPSPKSTYSLILAICVGTMLFGHRFSHCDVFSTLLAGFSCGLIHHAALFFHGMRGYTDLPSLLLTLLTEWPALICAERVLRHYFSTAPKCAQLCRLALPGAILSIILSKFDPDRVAEQLVPVIPGQYMQSVGTLAFRMSTCIVPELVAAAPTGMRLVVASVFGLPWPLLDCREEGDDSIWVVAAPAKSGALLSAHLLMSMGARCQKMCVGSGERNSAGIPGPVETPPAYDGQALHAIINMRTWPEWVARRNKSPRCVALLRDPLARLRSLYLYARSGGEAWFRYGGLMQQLRAPKTLNASITLYWKLFGRGYLEQSHDYNKFNLHQGCVGIKFERFKEDYNGTIRQMLSVWGVRAAAVDGLVDAVAKYDATAQSAVQQRDNPHMSAAKYSPVFVAAVTDTLMSIADVQGMVESHRLELGY